MKSSISLLIFTLTIYSCSTSKSNELKLVSTTEYIEILEALNFPELDSIVISNSNNQTITTEEVQKLMQADSSFIDLYKDLSGNVVAGIIREKTEADEKLMSQVFKIELTTAELEEINQLSSTAAVEKYLINLWDEDQGIRTDPSEDEVWKKHGWNSREHRKSEGEFIKKDKRIFAKMKRFLEVYGYPKETKKFHWKAENAFETIIGHNGNYDEQKEVLVYLAEAYKKGHCDLKGIVWILGEMYERKNKGQRYKMKSDVFTGEQEFKELCEALNINLDELATKQMKNR